MTGLYGRPVMGAGGGCIVVEVCVAASGKDAAPMRVTVAAPSAVAPAVRRKFLRLFIVSLSVQGAVHGCAAGGSRHCGAGGRATCHGALQVGLGNPVVAEGFHVPVKLMTWSRADPHFPSMLSRVQACRAGLQTPPLRLENVMPKQEMHTLMNECAKACLDCHQLCTETAARPAPRGGSFRVRAPRRPSRLRPDLSLERRFHGSSLAAPYPRLCRVR